MATVRRALGEFFHMRPFVIRKATGKMYIAFKSTTDIIAHLDGNRHTHFGYIVSDPRRGVLLVRVRSFGKDAHVPLVGSDTKQTEHYEPWGPGLRPYVPREIGPTLVLWHTSGTCAPI